MSNRYQSYRNRGGIRFFPHIIPIAFPLIFPLGIGLVFWLLHGLFTILGILLLVLLVVFIFRAITLKEIKQDPNDEKDHGGNEESVAPPKFLRRVTSHI